MHNHGSRNMTDGYCKRETNTYQRPNQEVLTCRAFLSGGSIPGSEPDEDVDEDDDVDGDAGDALWLNTRLITTCFFYKISEK
jgi:hypothetical protein